MKLILPNTFVDLNEFPRNPLFFIAGPIRGGDDHQSELSVILAKKVPDCIIITPCRYSLGHPLYRYRLEGDEEYFERQLSYERYYLRRAAKAKAEGRRGGAILFNLPCESRTRPRTDGQPYARDSYQELGEWRGQMMYDKTLKVLIAAEAGFPGLSQIRYNFSAALEHDFPIYKSIDELTDQAALLVE
ncbi:MAG: hypothetical protein JWM39_714 [Parcubacteria group bacterium]|nr:hypothetical protein [Parcubacteria group bacterium]